jgi:hypothetical protein
MRSLFAAILLIASVHAAHAGALVELTDGTKLTVEGHWSDGDQIHLVRGGVDMIVAKSKIKSIDENVEDPEVYREGTGGKTKAAAPADGEPEAAQAEGEKSLSELNAAELQALHEEEAPRILDAQQKRFAAGYRSDATADEKRQATEAFEKENERNAQIWFALQKAKTAEARAMEAQGTLEPAQPVVAQPGT